MVGFLSQMNKAVETGLKASGQIEGGGNHRNVHVDQVIILPMPPVARPAPRSIDCKAVSVEPEDA